MGFCWNEKTYSEKTANALSDVAVRVFLFSGQRTEA